MSSASAKRRTISAISCSVTMNGGAIITRSPFVPSACPTLGHTTSPACCAASVNASAKCAARGSGARVVLSSTNSIPASSPRPRTSPTCGSSRSAPSRSCSTAPTAAHRSTRLWRCKWRTAASPAAHAPARREARIAPPARTAVGMGGGERVHVHQPLAERRPVLLARGGGERQQRVPMIGGRERDDLVLLGSPPLYPVLPGQLHRRFQRLGAARQEVQLVEVAGQGGGELLSQLLDRAVGEGRPREIAELPRLLRHGVRDVGVRVAEVGDVGAADSVEGALATLVDKPAPLAPHDAWESAPQLAVEDVAVGIAVSRHPHSRRCELAESYDAGAPSASRTGPVSDGRYLTPMITKLLRLLLVAPLVGGAPLLAQTVPPGDNLVTDGVPPVPASIADAARRYSEFRSAAFWHWHPTRREILVCTRFGDAQPLHPRRLPGGGA